MVWAFISGQMKAKVSKWHFVHGKERPWWWLLWQQITMMETVTINQICRHCSVPLLRSPESRTPEPVLQNAAGSIKVNSGSLMEQWVMSMTMLTVDMIFTVTIFVGIFFISTLTLGTPIHLHPPSYVLPLRTVMVRYPVLARLSLLKLLFYKQNLQ